VEERKGSELLDDLDLGEDAHSSALMLKQVNFQFGSNQRQRDLVSLDLNDLGAPSYLTNSEMSYSLYQSHLKM